MQQLGILAKYDCVTPDQWSGIPKRCRDIYKECQNGRWPKKQSLLAPKEEKAIASDQNPGFLKDTVKILDRAHARATSYQNLVIHPEHVLEELLQMDEPEIHRLIDALGIDRKRAIRLLELTSKGIEKVPRPGREFSSAMKKALSSALTRAESQKRHVTSSDIFFGILVTCNRFGALFKTLGIQERRPGPALDARF